jgi:hypothetical protein
MSGDRHVEKLMDKLLRAIEVSLRATEASREAIREILRRGADTGIFFTGTESPAGAPAKAAEDGGSDAGRGFDLTQQDRDFLRSFCIRPDPR